jgi:hypothetical protein
MTEEKQPRYSNIVVDNETGEVVDMEEKRREMETMAGIAARDQAKWNAAENRKRFDAEREAAAKRAGISSERLKKYISKNLHMADAERRNYFERMAQQAKREMEIEKWDVQAKPSLTATGSLKYKPSKELRERHNSGNDVLNDVIADIVRTL